MRLPSLATVAVVLAVLSVALFVAIGLGIGYLTGDYRWTVGVAAALILLGVPPIFVAVNLIERYTRIRRARNFRLQARKGRSSPAAGAP